MIKTIFIILFVIIILIIIFKSVNKFTKKEKFTEQPYKSEITLTKDLKHAMFVSGFKSLNTDSLVEIDNRELLDFNYINVLTYLDSFLRIYFPQLFTDYIRQFLTIEHFLLSDSFKQITKLIEEDINVGDILEEDIVTRYKIRNSITILYKYYENIKNRPLILGNTQTFQQNLIDQDLNNILNKTIKLKQINEKIQSFKSTDVNDNDIEIFNFNITDIIKYNMENVDVSSEISTEEDTKEVKIIKINNIIKICNNITSLAHIKNKSSRTDSFLNIIGMLILHRIKKELETENISNYCYQLDKENIYIGRVSRDKISLLDLEQVDSDVFNVESDLNFNKKYNMFEITDIYYDNIYNVIEGTDTSLPEEFNKFLNTINTEYITYIKLIEPFINDNFEKLLLNIFNNRCNLHDFYVFLLNMSEIGKISVHYKERDEAGFGNLRERLNNLINPDSVTTSNVTTTTIFTGPSSEGSRTLQLTNQFCNNFYETELNGCNYYIDKEIGELTNDDIESIQTCLASKLKIENMPYKAIKLDAIMQKLNAFFIIMDVIDVIVLLLTLGGAVGFVIGRKVAVEAAEEIAEQSLKQVIKTAIKPAFTQTFKNVTKKGFWKGLYNFGKGIIQFSLYIMFVASKIFEGILVIASGGLLAPLIWSGGGATRIINKIAKDAIDKAITKMGVKAFSELGEEGKQRLLRSIAESISRKAMIKIVNEGVGNVKALLGATGNIQKKIYKTVTKELGSVFNAKLIVSNSIKELAVKSGEELVKESSELLDNLVTRVLVENGAVVKNIDGEEKIILKNGDDFDIEIENVIKSDLIEYAGKIPDIIQFTPERLTSKVKDTINSVKTRFKNADGSLSQPLKNVNDTFVKKGGKFAGDINDEIISVNRKIGEIGGEGFNAEKEFLQIRASNLSKLADSSDESLDSVIIDFHTQSFLAKHGASVTADNIDELMEKYLKEVSEKSALDSEIDSLFFYDSSIYKQDFSNALAKAAKESDIEDEGINFVEFHLEFRKMVMHYMTHPQGSKMLPITKDNFQKVYLMLFKQLSGSDNSAMSNLIRIFGRDTSIDIDSFMKQLIEQDFDEFFPVLVKEGDDYIPNAADEFPIINKKIDVDAYLAQYIDPQDAIIKYGPPPPKPQNPYGVVVKPSVPLPFKQYDDLPLIGRDGGYMELPGVYDDLPSINDFTGVNLGKKFKGIILDETPEGVYDRVLQQMDPAYFQPAATRGGNDTYLKLDRTFKEPEYLEIAREPEYLTIFPRENSVNIADKLDELLKKLRTRSNDINNEQFILDFFNKSGLTEDEIVRLQRFMIDGNVAGIPIKVRKQALEIREFISILPLTATGGVAQTSSSRIATFFNTILDQIKRRVRRGSVDLLSGETDGSRLLKACDTFAGSRFCAVKQVMGEYINLDDMNQSAGVYDEVLPPSYLTIQETSFEDMDGVYQAVKRNDEYLTVYGVNDGGYISVEPANRYGVENIYDEISNVISKSRMVTKKLDTPVSTKEMFDTLFREQSKLFIERVKLYTQLARQPRFKKIAKKIAQKVIISALKSIYRANIYTIINNINESARRDMSLNNKLGGFEQLNNIESIMFEELYIELVKQGYIPVYDSADLRLTLDDTTYFQIKNKSTNITQFMNYLEDYDLVSYESFEDIIKTFTDISTPTLDDVLDLIKVFIVKNIIINTKTLLSFNFTTNFKDYQFDINTIDMILKLDGGVNLLYFFTFERFKHNNNPEHVIRYLQHPINDLSNDIIDKIKQKDLFSDENKKYFIELLLFHQIYKIDIIYDIYTSIFDTGNITSFFNDFKSDINVFVNYRNTYETLNSLKLISLTVNDNPVVQNIPLVTSLIQKYFDNELLYEFYIIIYGNDSVTSNVNDDLIITETNFTNLITVNITNNPNVIHNFYILSAILNHYHGKYTNEQIRELYIQLFLNETKLSESKYLEIIKLDDIIKASLQNHDIYTENEYHILKTEKIFDSNSYELSIEQSTYNKLLSHIRDTYGFEYILSNFITIKNNLLIIIKLFEDFNLTIDDNDNINEILTKLRLFLSDEDIKKDLLFFTDTLPDITNIQYSNITSKTKAYYCIEQLNEHLLKLNILKNNFKNHISINDTIFSNDFYINFIDLTKLGIDIDIKTIFENNYKEGKNIIRDDILNIYTTLQNYVDSINKDINIDNMNILHFDLSNNDVDYLYSNYNTNNYLKKLVNSNRVVFNFDSITNGNILYSSEQSLLGSLGVTSSSFNTISNKEISNILIAKYLNFNMPIPFESIIKHYTNDFILSNIINDNIIVALSTPQPQSIIEKCENIKELIKTKLSEPRSSFSINYNNIVDILFNLVDNIIQSNIDINNPIYERLSDIYISTIGNILFMKYKNITVDILYKIHSRYIELCEKHNMNKLPIDMFYKSLKLGRDELPLTNMGINSFADIDSLYRDIETKYIDLILNINVKDTHILNFSDANTDNLTKYELNNLDNLYKVGINTIDKLNSLSLDFNTLLNIYIGKEQIPYLGLYEQNSLTLTQLTNNYGSLNITDVLAYNVSIDKLSTFLETNNNLLQMLQKLYNSNILLSGIPEALVGFGFNLDNLQTYGIININNYKTLLNGISSNLTLNGDDLFDFMTSFNILTKQELENYLILRYATDNLSEKERTILYRRVNIDIFDSIVFRTLEKNMNDFDFLLSCNVVGERFVSLVLTVKSDDMESYRTDIKNYCLNKNIDVIQFCNVFGLVDNNILLLGIKNKMLDFDIFHSTKLDYIGDIIISEENEELVRYGNLENLFKSVDMLGKIDYFDFKKYFSQNENINFIKFLNSIELLDKLNLLKILKGVYTIDEFILKCMNGSNISDLLLILDSNLDNEFEKDLFATKCLLIGISIDVLIKLNLNPSNKFIENYIRKYRQINSDLLPSDKIMESKLSEEQYADIETFGLTPPANLMAQKFVNDISSKSVPVYIENEGVPTDITSPIEFYDRVQQIMYGTYLNNKIMNDVKCILLYSIFYSIKENKNFYNKFTEAVYTDVRNKIIDEIYDNTKMNILPEPEVYTVYSRIGRERLNHARAMIKYNNKLHKQKIQLLNKCNNLIKTGEISDDTSDSIKISNNIKIIKNFCNRQYSDELQRNGCITDEIKKLIKNHYEPIFMDIFKINNNTERNSKISNILNNLEQEHNSFSDINFDKFKTIVINVYVEQLSLF